MIETKAEAEPIVTTPKKPNDAPPEKPIVIARVNDVRPHPRADSIRLALVDLGDGKPFQVVYGGALVLESGQLVAVAPPGSRLPTGVKMRRRRYRGEWSHGMLCSTTELGWEKCGPLQVAIIRAGNRPGKSLAGVKSPMTRLLDPRYR